MSGSGIGLYTIVDMTNTVTVQARDSNGNYLTTGGSYFYLKVENQGTSHMKDLGDGSYSATYTVS